MAPTLLLSDLHLSPARPRAVAAFHAFARGPGARAAAVYILGDLFDWWVGDDQLREPLRPRGSPTRCARIIDAGVPLYVARGNRDFLLGERFARGDRRDAARPSARCAGSADVATLLTHGDELCTDDVAYQAFRARSRDPAWQRAHPRACPTGCAARIALYLRLRSRAATAQKPESIMDVNAGAVADAFRAHGVARMVHGHTHRPARHEHDRRRRRRASATCSPPGTTTATTSRSTGRACASAAWTPATEPDAARQPSACAKSASRSSRSSMPTEMRISDSAMPISARRAAPIS